MKHIHIFLLAFLLGLPFVACDNETTAVTPHESGGDTNPAGKLVSASACKSGAAGEGVTFNASSSEMQYRYDAATKTLHLTHINAAFNCCPGTISVDVDIEEHLITLVERESSAECNCLCLYDLEVAVTDLPQAEYRIVVVEPYLQKPDQALSFTMDLVTRSTGSHSVPRNNYPWSPQ